MLKNSFQNQESPLASGRQGPRVTKGEEGEVSLFCRFPAGRLYVDMPPGGLGAKKKQGSGRSPEILMVHWPFGLSHEAS